MSKNHRSRFTYFHGSSMLNVSMDEYILAAKLRREAGESVEQVSRFLDHSSLAVTVHLQRLEGDRDTTGSRWLRPLTCNEAINWLATAIYRTNRIPHLSPLTNLHAIVEYSLISLICGSQQHLAITEFLWKPS